MWKYLHCWAWEKPSPLQLIQPNPVKPSSWIGHKLPTSPPRRLALTAHRTRNLYAYQVATSHTPDTGEPFEHVVHSMPIRPPVTVFLHEGAMGHLARDWMSHGAHDIRLE